MAFFLVGSVGQLLLQTNSVSGEGFPQIIGRPIIVLLTNTYWGGLWLWRMGLFLLLAAALPLSNRLNPGREWGQSWERPREIIALVTTAALMLTLSLVSHAFATTEIRITAVISDYLHLLAASMWAGGLFHFASNAHYFLKKIPAAGRRPLLAAIVPCFSSLAVLSVASLILTGLFSSYAQVTVISALDTPYGRTLLIKLALIIPLLALGAVNLLYLSRRLASQPQAGIQLGRTVKVEALLVVCVLFSVGFLVTMEPARQVASRQQVNAAPTDARLRLEDTAERLTGTFILDAAQAGDKQVTVELTNPTTGQPIENASDVLLTIVYPAEDLQPLVGRPRAVAPGVFEFDDVPFSLMGQWQANLVVVRPTAFDAHLSYEFDIGGQVETAVPETNNIAPTAETARWLFAFTLIGLILVAALNYRVNKRSGNGGGV
jgi:copper transport protein